MTEAGGHLEFDELLDLYGKQWLPMAKQCHDRSYIPYDLRELVVFGQIDENGRQALTLVRVYCTGPERHTHVLLPDFRIPYVHHLCTTYKQVLHNEETRVYLLPSTLHRISKWWDWLQSKFSEAIRVWQKTQSAERELAAQIVSQINLRPLISYLVNCGHWRFSRLAKTSP